MSDGRDYQSVITRAAAEEPPSPLGEREPSGAGESWLAFRWPIDLRLTVMSHGWAQLAPWRWDPECLRLVRTERVGGSVGTVTVEQPDPHHLAVSASEARRHPWYPPDKQ